MGACYIDGPSVKNATQRLSDHLLALASACEKTGAAITNPVLGLNSAGIDAALIERAKQMIRLSKEIESSAYELILAVDREYLGRFDDLDKKYGM